MERIQRLGNLKTKALLLGETDQQELGGESSTDDSASSDDDAVATAPQRGGSRRRGTYSSDSEEETEPYWSAEQCVSPPLYSLPLRANSLIEGSSCLAVGLNGGRSRG